MAETTVKLNRLGKPIMRDSRYKFAKGNQEGKRFGYELKPGRREGCKNLMTIIKEIALEKQSNDGKSNFEFVMLELFANQRKMKKVLTKLEEDGKEGTPEYKNWLNRYQDNSIKLSEHAVKYSGDYTQKIQTDATESLSSEEKQLMERMIKKTK